MGVFTHQDTDQDRLEFLEQDGKLVAHITPHVRYGLPAVSLGRETVERLYNALGEWLYPVHTPEAPNRSVIEELVARAVRDQVAAILPLHLATAKVICTQDASCDGEDPSPHEAGHPEPSRPRQPCGEPLKPGYVLLDVHEECGFVWALHPAPPRPETEPEHGRLMASLPRRPQAVPKCLDCLHGWGEHTGGICWGASPDGLASGGALGCTCTRERPAQVRQSAPAPAHPRCTCGHLHGAHGFQGGFFAICLLAGCTCRKYEAAPESAPAHPNRTCGPCGKPWSDGHGQPGDPCEPPPFISNCARPGCDHAGELHTGPFGCSVSGCECAGYNDGSQSSAPECAECGHEYRHHLLGGRPNCHSFGCRCTRYRSAR